MTAPADYQPPPLVWRECTNSTLVQFGAKCALLTVPLDYANPSGPKIKIAVSRIKHTTSDADAQGIMLTNPGGPGGSGLVLSVLGNFIPGGGGAPYDWIGFDPRGVGESQPRLACTGGYFPYNRPDYVPRTAALRDFWLAKSARYAAMCGQAGGALLDHLKTTDSVNDMESIRKALGANTINYYGFSYGTYLGQVYATLHPDRVRRMVMDGVLNSRRAYYLANLDQDRQFDRNMDVFFGWVAKYNSVYHLGKTTEVVRDRWYALLRQSRRAPFAGKVGPDEWTDSFLSAAYGVGGWPTFAGVFAATAGGNYDPIVELYGGVYGSGPGSDNLFAVYNAVQCTDVKWPGWAQTSRDNWAVHREAPFITWSNAWFNAPCLTWPGRPGTKVTVNGSRVAPVLFIAETGDGATPFTGALLARSLFPRSVLIEGVGGTTHSGSLSGIACTDNRIGRYLLTGRLDARKPGAWTSDVRCPPVPQPDPTAKAATADRLPTAVRDALSTAQRH
ncbi:MAG: alpha/beta fold hydrolase [Tetrasphaera sp.]